MAEQALTVYVNSTLPIPVGCTPKQVRLAELALRFDPTTQTLAGICKEAGYADATATQSARQLLNSTGVQRATAAIQRQQLDSARGFMAISKDAAATVSVDIKELAPRDRIATIFKAAEVAMALGENVEQTGDADAWHRRQRRACLLMARLTAARLLLPPPLQAAAAARHAARQAQRR